MSLAICPYCSGIGILSNRCKEDLLFKQEGECTCTKCKRTFIIYYDNKKTKTKIKECINNAC